MFATALVMGGCLVWLQLAGPSFTEQCSMPTRLQVAQRATESKGKAATANGSATGISFAVALCPRTEDTMRLWMLGGETWRGSACCLPPLGTLLPFGIFW